MAGLWGGTAGWSIDELWIPASCNNQLKSFFRYAQIFHGFGGEIARGIRKFGLCDVHLGIEDIDSDQKLVFNILSMNVPSEHERDHSAR